MNKNLKKLITNVKNGDNELAKLLVKIIEAQHDYYESIIDLMERRSAEENQGIPRDQQSESSTRNNIIKDKFVNSLSRYSYYGKYEIRSEDIEFYHGGIDVNAQYIIKYDTKMNLMIGSHIDVIGSANGLIFFKKQYNDTIYCVNEINFREKVIKLHEGEVNYEQEKDNAKKIKP